MGTSPAMRRKVHGHSIWRWRLGILVVLGIVVFLGVTQFQEGRSPTEGNQYFTTIPDEVPAPKPKIAFLFIARNQMPLDFLWAHFFKGAAVDEYSVYIHARPGVIYTRKNSECKAFYNRQLPNSVSVEWGGASMIEAERLLLAAALEDPKNERFLLLSDSCVPLYTFKYVFDYVVTSPRSFVDSFIDYNDERYNPRMAPDIKEDRWRKGSQWFVLLRKHAEAIVADKTIFPNFQKHCKRLALPEYWRTGENQTETNCIPDEHYVQTLLAILGLEEQIERRTLTYSKWKDFDQERDRKGWHPITFNYPDASLEAVKDIQAIIKIEYVTESRTEWCSSNGEPHPCYLFARKFTKGAGIRLLDMVKKYEKPPDPIH
ncbi:unnamed protein product [Calypogeia fissa]